MTKLNGHLKTKADEQGRQQGFDTAKVLLFIKVKLRKVNWALGIN